MKKRIEELDILKGLAMVLVILGHFYHPHVLAYIIWSFHMPLFIIVSGYFIKDEPFESAKKRTKLLINKYLKVYAITWLALYLYKICTLVIKELIFESEQQTNIIDLTKNWLISFIYAQGNEILIGEKVIPTVGPIWFLMALAMGQLIVCVTIKSRNLKFRVIIITAISIALTIVNNYIQLPLQMYAGALFACWLMLGFLVKQYKNSNCVMNLLEPTKFFQLFVVIVWLLIVDWELYLNEPFDVSKFKYNLNFVGIIGACAGTLCCYYLARIIAKHSIKIKKILIYLGENTLIILAVHSFDLVSLTPLWDRIKISSFIIMLCRFAFEIALTIIIKLLINKREGEK